MVVLAPQLGLGQPRLCGCWQPAVPPPRLLQPAHKRRLPPAQASRKGVAGRQQRSNPQQRQQLAADEWEAEEDEDEEQQPGSQGQQASNTGRGPAPGPGGRSSSEQQPPRAPAPGGRPQRGGTEEPQSRFRKWLESRLAREAGEGGVRRFLSEEELLQYREQYAVYMQKRAKSYSKQITVMIKKASTWQQVGRVLREKERALDEIHLSAAVGRLCQLYEDGWVGELEAPDFQALIERVLGRMAAQRASVRPQEIALTLHSLSKLDNPPEESIKVLLVEATEKLRQFTAGDLSTMLYALARMSVSPGDKWLTNVLQVSYPMLDTYQPDHLANTVLAMGRLGHRPDPYWWEAFFKTTFHKFSSFSPRQVANMLFGLGLLGVRPDQEWLAGCNAFTYQCLADLTVNDLKRTVWALAQFDHVPNVKWQALYMQRLQLVVDKAVTEDLVTILASMAYLRFDTALLGQAPAVSQFWGAILAQLERVRRTMVLDDVQSLNRSLAALGSPSGVKPLPRVQPVMPAMAVQGARVGAQQR